jgi:hypothetical protein
VDVARADTVDAEHPTFGEARHLLAIDIQTIAEVEVLYLYLMLTCCYGSNDVLALAWEGETIG